MTSLNTPAIVLRRIEFGDYDLIVTLFTPTGGKTSAIAKSAKKSVKRFPGILEPFSLLDVVLSSKKGKGLPVLQEAFLEEPFFRIREDMIKTAYASYWAELIVLWMAEDAPQEELYQLMRHVLAALDRNETPVEVLSILFQMRFLSMAGFRPNFDHCHACKTHLDHIRHHLVLSEPSRGGIVCPSCGGAVGDRMTISKGTLKQLIWTDAGGLERAARVRFTPSAVAEGLAFLEAFVPYHIGKSPKSLKVLRAIRAAINGGRRNASGCGKNR